MNECGLLNSESATAGAAVMAGKVECELKKTGAARVSFGYRVLPFIINLVQNPKPMLFNCRACKNSHRDRNLHFLELHTRT